MTGSLLVKNVWLADGSGSPLRKCACLTDKNGRIAAVEKEFSACAAEKIIDGKGLILAPGFIDAHGHSDISGVSSPECFSKITQGITTEICGNCGLSAFPVTPENREHLQELYANYGVKISWESCEGYTGYCRAAGSCLDLIPLCGHNTLRGACCGYGEGESSCDELEKMKALLDRELRSGAAGVSFGLLYTPGIFAADEEIVAVMETAARHDKVCAAHLRSEGDLLLESAAGMIDLSREAGLRHFHFSHLKTAGKNNFSKLDRIFELFDEARHCGLEITYDRYPYIESMTQLSVALPGKWGELDDVTLKKELASVGAKEVLTAQLREAKDEEYWERCRIVNCTHPSFAPFRGVKITAIPGDPAANAVEMLAFDPVETRAAFAVMSEENMKRILLSPFCVAGSDGNALPPDGSAGHSHPRAFGAIPRFVRLLLDWGESVENAVYKCSGQTAAIFGLADRGIIRPGQVGDLVLFDPDSIDGKADFSAPETPSEGIVCVVKNGEIIFNR